ncbi:MAG: hypothetical protein GXP34_13815 [Actinobacteria bacterium]|nr:hypothetical protein [Actinomycetota bacterium]
MMGLEQHEGAAPRREMTADVVHRYVDLFDELGLAVWLDGGWGVDVPVGEQTRPHADLDTVIQREDVQELRDALAGSGFEDVETDDRTDWNFIMASQAGQRIDFHIIVIDEQGRGNHGPPESGVFYPSSSLQATGTVDGRTIRRLSAEHQVQSHTGYELDENDIEDVTAMHERFGEALRDGYPADLWKIEED